MVLKSQSDIHISAPGRICLFGDHQDYLGLPVIACAIDRYIYLEASLNNKSSIKIIMPDIDKERIIDLNKEFISISERDYVVSSLKVLKRYGIEPNRGYDVILKGDIPINAGLSSSSAIVVAWIRFLLEAFGNTKHITSEYVAKLAFEAEVLEYNSPGGLMDQYSISIGNLIYLNTVNGDYNLIDKKVESLIIGESGIPKKTLGVLSQLRGKALESINLVAKNVPSFKIEESTLNDYDLYKQYVSEDLQSIFYAAIKNYNITKQAFSAFSEDELNINFIGNLMTEHHKILKDILRITVPRIDDMVESSLKNNALGAKIVGSGGGGCIVALTNQQDEENVIEGMLKAGARNAYKVNITKGVGVVNK